MFSDTFVIASVKREAVVDLAAERYIQWFGFLPTANLFPFEQTNPMRFSLIDRIIEIEPEVRISAIKTLSMAEEYLADHFPHFPVMPGVLMLEAMTQASAWLVRHSENFAHSVVALKEAANVKYAQFLEPGQTLLVNAEILKSDESETKLKANGMVDGRIIVTSRLTLCKYNLADERPWYECNDQSMIRDLRGQFNLLYQPRTEVSAVSSI
jgi:3-hydroxyacyl-[acyl-carrier-protein] dehydratase